MDNCIKVIQYFRERGVSVIFLFRRNLLRRLVSQLANDHDRSTKQLNGTHKAHVHSENEVSLSCHTMYIPRLLLRSPKFYVTLVNNIQANILAMYKPRINTSELISNLKNAEKFASNALEHFNNIRHIVLYYEDLLQNGTVSSACPLNSHINEKLFNHNSGSHLLCTIMKLVIYL